MQRTTSEKNGMARKLRLSFYFSLVVFRAAPQLTEQAVIDIHRIAFRDVIFDTPSAICHFLQRFTVPRDFLFCSSLFISSIVKR